jgi:hypothetical protein
MEAPDAAPSANPGSLRRLPAAYLAPAAAAVAWDAPPEGRDEAERIESLAGETARHVGTVVHRWLQRVAEDELKGWDARAWNRCGRGSRRNLNGAGFRHQKSFSRPIWLLLR